MLRQRRENQLSDTASVMPTPGNTVTPVVCGHSSVYMPTVAGTVNTLLLAAVLASAAQS